MPLLSVQERIRIIWLFNSLGQYRGDRYKETLKIAEGRLNIKISLKGLCNLVKKWRQINSLQDYPRTNAQKQLISFEGMLAINRALLNDPNLTSTKLKLKLNLVASVSAIRRAMNKMGWKTVRTRSCQTVHPINQVKRFIFACFCKQYNEDFDDVIDQDECIVEMRWYTAKTWLKTKHPTLRAHGGKLGKVKHNIKVSLFGAISRKGLTPLIIFNKRMFSDNFQYFLAKSIILHIRAKYPFRHRLFMDNDPKHTSESTTRFMQINNINHFPTPVSSFYFLFQ